MNNNNYKDTDDEITIDLKEIAYVLMEKLHYIVMFLLVGAVVFNMYSYFLIKHIHQHPDCMWFQLRKIQLLIFRICRWEQT